MTEEQIESLLFSGRYKDVVCATESVISSGAATYAIFLYRGVAFQQLGQYQEAIAAFDKTVEINPQCASAYGNRGSIKDLMGRPDLAVVDHNLALRLEPQECQHYYNRGLAYANAKDFKQAVEDFTSAIELNPSYKEALQWRAECYRKLGMKEESILDGARAKQGQAHNFTDQPGKGIGCFAQVLLIWGTSLGLGMAGLGKWWMILAGSIVVLLLDAVVMRLQNKQTFGFEHVIARIVLHIPVGLVWYWLGGKLMGWISNPKFAIAAGVAPLLICLLVASNERRVD